ALIPHDVIWRTRMAELTVFSLPSRWRGSQSIFQKIGRLTPIVAETEQIADCRNSLLESTARVSDVSRRRCLTLRRKNFSHLYQRVIIALNDRVGLKGM